jgi:hypothetical protein
MILNKHSFNIPSISIISSESEKWINEIKTHVSPDVIEEYKKTSTSTYLRKRYSTINKEQANEEIINIIDSNLYNISIMPSETKENITDIFFIISSLLMKLSERERALSVDLSLDKGLVCEYLFTTLLPWKVRAHEITVKSNGSISAKNKTELYKLKMFLDVKSKVAESIKMFKSYRPMKKKIKASDKINKINNLSSIDNMINKLEDEAKQKEQKLSETLPAIN